MSSIELLAPAGSEESLVAAVESACDAVYLGLDGFNARSRAKNFRVEELPDVIAYCHKKSVKVFITLNTLVKNNELGDLLKLVYQIVHCRPDAIIIQDFALLYLLHKLNYQHIHFSTQAGIHNSLGVTFATQKGVERSILSRELTLDEIRKASEVGETELFVHGALCYSLSGLCLFSSYLGGMSANRGKCKQPCRRSFNITKRKQEHIFSLKDLELLDVLPQIRQAGVKSLKIEGRMKRSDYVKQVVKAYRLALDNPEELTQARTLLESDFGRAKTSYFTGGSVANAITNKPFAGILLGEAKVRGDKLIFFKPFTSSSRKGDKVKLYFGEADSETYTIIEIVSQIEIIISAKLPNAEKVSVYKVSANDEKSYNHSFKKQNLPNITKAKLKELLATDYKADKTDNCLYIRIKKLSDIKLIPQTKYIHFYLVPLAESAPLSSDRKTNIYWELPLFIAEADLNKTQEIINNLHQQGHNNFAISHISQLLLLPKSANILTNENVYTMNDIAVLQLKKWGMKSYILPVENDIPNLNHYNNKDGIIPIFFTPALFSSRLPVKDRLIKDKKNSYQIVRKGKLTLTYPLDPVCIFSFIKKMRGYSRYMIDLSTPNISQDSFLEIFSYFSKEQNIPNSSKFNFKKGLW